MSNRAKIASILSVGLVTAAATLAPTAHADPVSDSFLTALTDAGIGYTDPASTVALGQSLCPMLVQPGGQFAAVASAMGGNNGMSPGMAALFTSIAISAFCPSMVSSFANGNLPFPLQIPGV